MQSTINEIRRGVRFYDPNQPDGVFSLMEKNLLNRINSKQDFRNAKSFCSYLHDQLVFGNSSSLNDEAALLSFYDCLEFLIRDYENGTARRNLLN
jgi:hypothetical protein